MNKCEYCGSEFDDRLSYCPSCGASACMKVPDAKKTSEIPAGYTQPVVIERHNNRTMLIIVVLCGIILMMACYMLFDKSVTGSTDNTTVATHAETPKKETQKNVSHAEIATYYSADVNRGVRAINAGDTSILDRSVSSAYYDAQCKLVLRLYGRGISEEFLTGYFGIRETAKNGTLTANVYEKHRIISANGIRYVDNFYINKMYSDRPYGMISCNKGINPFTPVADAYITADYADLYVMPNDSALIFDRAMAGDSVKICEYPDSDERSPVYELSPDVASPEGAQTALITIHVSELRGEWTFIKHPRYGYAWVKNSAVSE